MSYRDPYTDRPYADRMNNNVDPMNPPGPRGGGWSRGGIIGVIAAIIVAAALIAYGTNRTPTNTATGPSTTTSGPSTTGQGGGAPAGQPSGIAR